MGEWAVTVDGLEKRFGSFTAVKGISFNVAKGEIFGFLGPNGAGKSTTIRMLCGIITPTAGKGTVAGYDINTEQEAIKLHIGYMSQKFSLYDDLTVDENINFYAGIYKLPRAERAERKREIIELAGIGDFTSQLTRTLSGGWKQRLALGCAIIHKPGIIFLDEPTSGVDPITRASFWSAIKDMARAGTTVFVTTHYMDEAENCDRMTLIYKGSIIAMGSPAEMKTTCMRDEVVVISFPAAEEWAARVREVPGVKEVSLFGADLHAVVEHADRVMPALRALLAAGGVVARVEKIMPSLEDVFVSLIEQYDRKA